MLKACSFSRAVPFNFTSIFSESVCFFRTIGYFESNKLQTQEGREDSSLSTRPMPDTLGEVEVCLYSTTICGQNLFQVCSVFRSQLPEFN